MPLLEDDVQRIVSLGFKEGSFAVESDGFKMLRNSSAGRCVFHDGKQCTIYSNRPAGCRLYPIIFDEDLNHPVKDAFCPYRDEFDLSLKAKRELSDVYLKLIHGPKFPSQSTQKLAKGWPTGKSPRIGVGPWEEIDP